jgi:sporulation protein YlmC with PRC-barrel domain
MRDAGGSRRDRDGSGLAAATLMLRSSSRGRSHRVRLELGTRVDCADDTFGELVDFVIDPTARRITHLVVEPDNDQWLARLVPVELVERGDDETGTVVLHSTVDEVRRLSTLHEIAYLRLGEFPVDDPDWDVGVEEVLALPYYPSAELEPSRLQFAVAYDRVPKGEIEIRRASAVDSADGHRLGAVDGFVVDHDEQITHLVLERGHLWERRDVAIPIRAVAYAASDAVMLALTKDEVDALPPTVIHRWPRAIEHGPRRR